MSPNVYECPKTNGITMASSLEAPRNPTRQGVRGSSPPVTAALSL